MKFGKWIYKRGSLVTSIVQLLSQNDISSYFFFRDASLNTVKMFLPLKRNLLCIYSFFIS